MTEQHHGGDIAISTDKARHDIDAIHSYLCDLFILEPYRGRGLSKQLVEYIIAHPDLQGLRRFCLGTRDAHGLYNRYGFLPQANPANNLEKRNQDVYRKMPS